MAESTMTIDRMMSMGGGAGAGLTTRCRAAPAKSKQPRRRTGLRMGYVLVRQHLNIRQVPVFLRVIEPIAYDEMGVDGEADVVGLEFHLVRGGLIEKRRGAHRRGSRCSGRPCGWSARCR